MKTTAMKTLVSIILATLSVFLYTDAYARNYSLSDGDTVIGQARSYTIKDNESLIEIAPRFDIGYNAITQANPGVDPFTPEAGSVVTVPTSWVLPEAPPGGGIVINLSEMRLYYFYRDELASFVMTFPVGIGREGWETPLREFMVSDKIIEPSWYVPESIKKEHPELPDIVPPGPKNPLGTRALRLSSGAYLIHGTNRPWGVGKRASHGCIRLYQDDIIELFSMVKKGERVTVVRQTVKIGTEDGRVYLEAHKDGHFSRLSYRDEAFKLLEKKGLLDSVDNEKLQRALIEMSGAPVDISK